MKATCVPALPPAALDLDPETDEALATLAKALAHPMRVQIVRILANCESSLCGDLVAQLPLAQSTVSQHLKVLKESGLVTERAAGTRRVYQLDAVAVAALRDQLDTFWKRATTGYQEVAEQPNEENP